MASVVARVLNIAIGFVTVPLTLSYLGTERFGLWMTLTSFVAFLTFTDMGLGIGLQNTLAHCHGRDDRESPRMFVSSGMLAMIFVLMGLILVSIFALPLLPWDRLIKAHDPGTRSELVPTAQVVMICFGIGLPSGLIDRIYSAYQQGYWSSVWLAIGRAMGLAGVFFCIWMKLGLPWLVAAAMGLPSLALIGGSVVFFVKHPWLVPSLRSVRIAAFRQILQIGMIAVIAQVGCAAIYSGPALVIANRLGAAAVTPFSVAQKLIGTAGILMTTLVMPLWPAYGEAAARGDWAWVKKTIWRTFRFGFAIQAPVFVAVLLLGRWIIRLWAGTEAVPDIGLLLSVDTWYLLAVVNLCTSIALNGINHMIGQATYGTGLAILGLGVAYLLAPSFGVNGVIWPVALIGTGITGVLQVIELKRAIPAAACSPLMKLAAPCDEVKV